MDLRSLATEARRSEDLQAHRQCYRQTGETMPLELEQLRQRIHEILSRVAEAPESRAPSISAAFEDLRRVLSDFVASGEELYQKIEELLALREALDHERQRYRELFEFAPDAHIVTELDGQIRLANRAAASLLQVRPNTLVSQSLLLFMSEPDRTLVLGHLADLRAGPPEVPQDWQLTMRPRHEESFSAIATVAWIQRTNISEAALHWILREAAPASA